MIDIFGMQIYHLATLVCIPKVPSLENTENAIWYIL
jgi:hypothetical protein